MLRCRGRFCRRGNRLNAHQEIETNMRLRRRDRPAAVVNAAANVRLEALENDGDADVAVQNAQIQTEPLPPEDPPGQKRTADDLDEDSNALLQPDSVPPRIPTFSYIGIKTHNPINETSIDVIEGDIFTLLCQSAGRPSPDYRWENGNIGNTSVIVARQSVNKTCTATNSMTETVGKSRRGSALTTISVTVLYTPTIPQMYICNRTGNKHNVKEYLSVIENFSFKLTCISNSSPNPQYKWYVNNSEISSQQELVKMNISRQQKGIYKCQVSNTMIRTFGERQHGTSNANTTINVLYPAEVGYLTETVVIEGSSIHMTCPIIAGNPAVTTVKWNPRGDLEGSVSHVLNISNISRKDEDIYVCSVTTRMRPTYGVPKEQVNYGQFQLTVVYKAHVTKFCIGMETDKNIFTVNETEDVTFMCYIDSKPSPNATILNEVEIVHVSGNNSLVYTKKNIQCTDFGLYTCSGINYYNYGIPSAKSLVLYVNCSPRPSPFIDIVESVKSDRNTSVTLSFTALAYPAPGNSGFTWNVLNGSHITPLSNSSNVVISSSKIQSNLTIWNVTQADYGQYILRIENPIDVFEQTFTLEPQDYLHRPLDTQTTSVSSKIGAFVGVGVGAFVTTLIIVVTVLTVYRRMRRKHTKNVASDVHDVHRQRIGTGIDSETSLTYESLDDSKKERDLYSQLPASYEQLDQVTKEKNSYMTIETTSHDISDYVNIKI